MLKEDAKAATRRVFQDSQERFTRVLGPGGLGGSNTPSEMRLGGRVSRAESAPLFR